MAKGKLTYKKTNSTSKSGVDFIQRIVHEHNCIFQEIDTKNDLGIDAIIEIIKDETPTSNFFATQIKSGKSYFNKKANLCKIPVKNHCNYWLNHPLPVYGIVYIPEFKDAYWVDIKSYLKKDPEATIIKFERTLANQINEATFFKIFIPHLLKEVPDIPFDFARELFISEKADEFFLGLYTLYKKYADRNDTWSLFIDYFQTKDIERIPNFLIYILAHLPWHPDIAYFNGTMTNQSQDYGKRVIKTFGKSEILKLLAFIDEENSIARGTIGQSVEAIISIIDDFHLHLKEIINDSTVPLNIREYAGLILAYNFGKKSIDDLLQIKDKDSWFIPELIDHLKEFGEFNPYG
jgi:hypothetical protein